MPKIKKKAPSHLVDGALKSYLFLKHYIKHSEYE